MITGKHLIELGFTPGPGFSALLTRAAEILDANPKLDHAAVGRELHAELPPAPPKLQMRNQATLLGVAILAENPEEAANLVSVHRQMEHLLRVPVVERGAIMPDACPAGSEPATIPVGGAIAVRNAVIPAAHSADISCSMFASFYLSDKPVAEELDLLTAATRFGAGGRYDDNLVHHPVIDEDVWNNPFLKQLKHYAVRHMADQGDGNHFAYLGETEANPSLIEQLKEAGYDQLAASLTPRLTYRVLVTHHGSRGLGAQLYKRGQLVALRQTAAIADNVPKNAAWISMDTPEGADYWDALQYVSRWTRANHQSIHERFLQRAGHTAAAQLGNEHNFVWKRGDLYYHGKGATPAWQDDLGRPMLGLIPLNMAEPILLVLGSNNQEFLSFAPHGAGRNLSRTALKTKIGDTAEQEQRMKESTQHIDVRWYSGQADISETPLAYKPAATVVRQIATFGLANVIAEIRPLGSIMAGEAPPAAWQVNRDAKKAAQQAAENP